MSFLQLGMLWALPLALLPLVIHLVNRMRHRTVEWAAMRFLQKVTRASTSMARVRQWLVLALRILACLVFIVALARPLFGGFLGLRFSAAPDTVVILLDRSASMQAKGEHAAGRSLRDLALRRVAESAAVYGGAPRLVLIDSAGGRPAQLPDAALLPDLATAAPTDAGADVPAMLSAALDHLAANPTGQAEIWIASDLQASSWRPEDPAWPLLESRIKAMQTPPRLKLLPVAGHGGDAALTLLGVRTTEVAGSGGRKWRHECSFAIHRTDAEPGETTLTFFDGANRQPVKLPLVGAFVRHRHVFETEAFGASRAAYIELPADANPGNNRMWFALGKPPQLATLVVGDATDRATRLCALASKAKIVSPAVLRAGDLRDAALVVWNAAEPAPEMRREVDALVAQGGALLLLPQPGAAWGGLVSFGAMAQAGKDASPPAPSSGGTEAPKSAWRIAQWEHAEGPFADSESGTPLSLDQLEAARRVALASPKEKGIPLALFADGAPMALRFPAGSGTVVALATSPDPDWSNLRLGGIFIPLMRRLQAEGGARFAPARYVACGNLAAEVEGPVERVPAEAADEGAAPVGDPAVAAGVFKAGTGLFCVNRPAAEDDLAFLSAEAAAAVFKTVPIRAFAAAAADDDGAIQTEIWRVFLVLMLVLLAAEGFLLIPGAAPAGRIGVKGGSQ